MTKTAKKTAKPAVPAKVYSARELKAKQRRAAEQERMGNVAAMAYGLSNEIEYKTCEETGFRVRLTPSTRDEARAFLTGRRAYDTDEVLEELGAGWLKYFEQAGYVVRYQPTGRFAGIFMITQKAAKSFGLPAVLPNGCPGNYVKVAA